MYYNKMKYKDQKCKAFYSKAIRKEGKKKEREGRKKFYRHSKRAPSDTAQLGGMCAAQKFQSERANRGPNPALFCLPRCGHRLHQPIEMPFSSESIQRGRLFLIHTPTLHVDDPAHISRGNISIKRDIFAFIDSELSGYQCDVTDLKTKTVSGCDDRYLKS